MEKNTIYWIGFALIGISLFWLIGVAFGLISISPDWACLLFVLYMGGGMFFIHLACND